MYTVYTRVYMWEAEPRLYWRVKLNGKWTWRVASILRFCEIDELFEVYPIAPPEVDESE